MKQFNLEEYLKNPSREIITRDGRDVRIICTDKKDSDFPIVALVKNEYAEGERCMCYTKEGKFYTDDSLASNADLFFATKKHEGWVSLLKDLNGDAFIGDPSIYESKEDAEKAMEDCSNYMTTIKIEWEE